MISVVIPNWNGRRHLKGCLDSLRRQSFQDYEVVLVDNGSSDGSVDFVREAFPEVKVIRFETNRGFSAAVNAGINGSHGEYIVLMNNDTEAHPDWLRELKSGLDEDEKVGFCASKVLYHNDRDTINSAGDALSVSGYARNIGRGCRDNEMYDVKKDVSGASAAAAIYRRRMLEDIGLFDEDFFAYLEDVDLSFRAQLKGYRCRYLPDAIIFHWEGGKPGHGGELAVFHVERNAVLNLAKNLPLMMVLRYCYAVLLAHTNRFIICLLKGRLPVWLSAKFSAFLYLFRVVKKRRDIQRSRKVSLGYLSCILEKRRFIWR